MNRDWQRLYRLHGFRPFGLLAVLLLVALVVIDRLAEDWSAAAQRRDELDLRVSRMKAKLDQLPRVEEALRASRGRMSAMTSRLVSAPDAAAASEQLARAAETWLKGLGATGKGARPMTGGQARGKDMATAEIVVRLLPQHLLRALDQWPQAPIAMRLVRLEVTVDNPDSPAALEARIRVESVFQRTESGATAAPPRGKVEPKATRKQDAR